MYKPTLRHGPLTLVPVYSWVSEWLQCGQIRWVTSILFPILFYLNFYFVTFTVSCLLMYMYLLMFKCLIVLSCLCSSLVPGCVFVCCTDCICRINVCIVKTDIFVSFIQQPLTLKKTRFEPKTMNSPAWKPQHSFGGYQDMCTCTLIRFLVDHTMQLELLNFDDHH
jgi:hypothetical protein